MRILIIATNVGRTAPGIVFERLISGLSVHHKIDILTADYDPSIDLRATNTFISKRIKIHDRIHKLLITIFGINPYDYYWARKAIKVLGVKSKGTYDLVFSFLSFHHYESLIAGKMIAEKYRWKFAVYSVDAVPAPIAWTVNQGYFDGVKRLIAKYLSCADAFFSANEKMLSYQLGTFTPKDNIITDVLYNPGLITGREFPEPETQTNCFLYTGGIYGPRKVIYLLAAFEKLLDLHQDSLLVFVGSRISANDLEGLKQMTKEKVKIYPFSKDLNNYYSAATALIDIDADIENDVFLSSKITNYLFINRIIICETSKNSPSDQLFKNITSIMQCDHNADQLCEAMCRSILIKGKITFEDRNDISRLFSLPAIIRRLNLSLAKLEV